MAVKAFLSYSSKDKQLAGQIHKHMERFGFEPFLAHDDIEPSEEWPKRIESELRVCHVFIPILTENFHQSNWTDQEVGFALCRRGVLIIPLNAGINPYGFIGKYQSYPVAMRDVESTCVTIAEIVAKRRSKFRDEIISAIINTFGQSNTYVEAEQNSTYLLRFKEWLTTEHIHEIQRLANSKRQIRESHGAQDNLRILLSNLQQKVDMSIDTTGVALHHLPNRDELVRTIHDVASTAIKLLIRTRELNQMKKETPYLIDTGITQAHEDANVAYLTAREKLAQEKLVAGYAFREPISDFVVCVMEQFDTRAELRPQDMSGLADINLKAEETVKQIDAIVSGKESS